MAQPIRVDNSRPATVRDTARTLGVSKKHTNELVRLVKQTLFKDATTGEFVIRTRKSGAIERKNRSRNASTKTHKTRSKRVKA